VLEPVEVSDAAGVTWVRAVTDLDLLSEPDGYAQLLAFWLGAALFVIGSVLDILDGALARRSGPTSSARRRLGSGLDLRRPRIRDGP